MTDSALGIRSDPTDAALVPSASRSRRPGWRDPRILVGLVIVAGSVLLGAKVLSSADDTVGVWAAASNLPAGTSVDSSDLRVAQIRFEARREADQYLSADRPLPDDIVLARAVGEGELVPRQALGDPADALVEVPVSVEEEAVPATVHKGSVVDVWVTPQAVGSDKAPAAKLVLDDVVVVKSVTAKDSLAPSGTRQVVVGVSPMRARDLGDALGRSATGRVTITSRA